MADKINDVLAYMRNLSRGSKRILQRINVAEWNDYWLTHCCKDIKESTQIEYQKVIESHINRVLGNIPLQALSHEDIQLFVDSLTMGIGINKPLSAKTVKNIFGVLHKGLEDANLLGYLPKNPAIEISLPRKEKKEIEALDCEILHQFFSAIDNHPKRLLFLTSIFTGMREGEVIALTWDCINWDTGIITVYRQLSNRNQEKEYRFTSLKNNKSRSICPAPFLMDELRKYKNCLKSCDDFVFKNENGKHYTRSAVYNSFQKVMKHLNCGKHVRFHDLRHTYAVLSLMAGDDVKTLQMNMGHYSAAFTLDVYAHRNAEMMKQSANKMESLVEQRFPELLERGKS